MAFLAGGVPGGRGLALDRHPGAVDPGDVITGFLGVGGLAWRRQPFSGRGRGVSRLERIVAADFKAARLASWLFLVSFSFMPLEWPFPHPEKSIRKSLVGACCGETGRLGRELAQLAEPGFVTPPALDGRAVDGLAHLPNAGRPDLARVEMRRQTRVVPIETAG